MRTMIMLALISLGLTFGCTTNDSGPFPDETAAEDEKLRLMELQLAV